MADQDHVETHDVSTSDLADRTTVSRGTTLNASSGMDRPRPATRSFGLSVEWADTVDDQLMDEAVLQISGAGHWFLEGWIGDHSVDFLVDSGSAVTALSCSFYQTLVRAGAPVGALQATPRKLRGCPADFGSGTLVPGGMDWRSLGGLPGGFRVCGDGIVMLFLSDLGEGWRTGGCTTGYTKEVAGH